MRKETGGFAFPHDVEERSENIYGEIQTSEYSHPGMTLRDYFAAKAMQGLTSDVTQVSRREGQSYVTEIASMSYMLADAMLKERNK